mmetsp:Transcript_10573/g.24848  ORF Transcript_10573/g.24848 Transcript_10573/m.24848 type:complete len:223 (-) Transcript_10573:300-968(-)
MLGLRHLLHLFLRVVRSRPPQPVLEGALDSLCLVQRQDRSRVCAVDANLLLPPSHLCCRLDSRERRKAHCAADLHKRHHLAVFRGPFGLNLSRALERCSLQDPALHLPLAFESEGAALAHGGRGVAHDVVRCFGYLDSARRGMLTHPRRCDHRVAENAVELAGAAQDAGREGSKVRSRLEFERLSAPLARSGRDMPVTNLDQLKGKVANLYAPDSVSLLTVL